MQSNSTVEHKREWVGKVKVKMLRKGREERSDKGKRPWRKRHE
jgi:hypothetical protein